MSRHSIKNALRLTRAARNAVTGRVAVRYANRPTVAELLEVCRAHLNAAEKALLEANREAVKREERRDRRAA